MADCKYGVAALAGAGSLNKDLPVLYSAEKKREAWEQPCLCSVSMFSHTRESYLNMLLLDRLYTKPAMLVSLGLAFLPYLEAKGRDVVEL